MPALHNWKVFGKPDIREFCPKWAECPETTCPEPPPTSALCEYFVERFNNRQWVIAVLVMALLASVSCNFWFWRGDGNKSGREAMETKRAGSLWREKGGRMVPGGNFQTQGSQQGGLVKIE
jgi:hypothetical protein